MINENINNQSRIMRKISALIMLTAFCILACVMVFTSTRNKQAHAIQDSILIKAYDYVITKGNTQLSAQELYSDNEQENYTALTGVGIQKFIDAIYADADANDCVIIFDYSHVSDIGSSQRIFMGGAQQELDSILFSEKLTSDVTEHLNTAAKIRGVSITNEAEINTWNKSGYFAVFLDGDGRSFAENAGKISTIFGAISKRSLRTVYVAGSLITCTAIGAYHVDNNGGGIDISGCEDISSFSVSNAHGSLTFILAVKNWENNINAGSLAVFVIVEGTANYKSEETLYVTIFSKLLKAELMRIDDTIVAPLVYNGTEHNPSAVAAELTADYDVSSEDNINAGTTILKITCKLNCAGELTIAFEIREGGQIALWIELEFRPNSSAAITSIEAVEGMDGISPQDSNIFIRLLPAADYVLSMYFKETENLNLSAATSASVGTLNVISVNPDMEGPEIRSDIFDGYLPSEPLPVPESPDGFDFVRWEINGAPIDKLDSLDENVVLMPIWRLKPPIVEVAAEDIEGGKKLSANIHKYSGIDYSYQWYVFENGQWTKIDGQTSYTITISSSGQYRCLVSARCGGLAAFGHDEKNIELPKSKSSLWWLWLLLGLITGIAVALVLWYIWLKKRLIPMHPQEVK